MAAAFVQMGPQALAIFLTTKLWDWPAAEAAEVAPAAAPAKYTAERRSVPEVHMLAPTDGQNTTPELLVLAAEVVAVMEIQILMLPEARAAMAPFTSASTIKEASLWEIIVF